MTKVYDIKDFNPAKAISGLIGRVRTEFLMALDKQLAPFDITAAQYVVMVMIANGQADSTSCLCKNMSYDPGAMTRMIDRLEAKGLVRRERPEENRRVVVIHMTEDGKAMYPQLVEASVGVLNTLLRGFTKAEVKQFEGFLQRILLNAG